MINSGVTRLLPDSRPYWWWWRDGPRTHHNVCRSVSHNKSILYVSLPFMSLSLSHMSLSFLHFISCMCLMCLLFMCQPWFMCPFHVSKDSQTLSAHNQYFQRPQKRWVDFSREFSRSWCRSLAKLSLGSQSCPLEKKKITSTLPDCPQAHKTTPWKY